jgi:hypothetical protein
VPLLVAVLSSEVAAQAFTDDFETGTLMMTDTPPGQWSLSSVDPMCSISASSLAAHRDAMGLLVVDGENTTDAGATATAWVRTSFTPVSGNFYARSWVQLPSSNDAGGAVSLMNTYRRLGTENFCNALVSFPGGVIGLYSSGQTTDTTDYSTAMLGPSWALIEVAAEGIGTASGTCRLWVNGTPQAAHLNIDWSATNWRPDSFALGEVFSAPDQTFTGTLYFDDVRTSTSPLASTFHLTVPNSVPMGACSAIAVALQSSVGSGATAPYSLSATLNAAGVTGGFFSDPSCQSPLAAASLTAGEGAKTIYFQASSMGNATLSADHLDFITGSASVSITDRVPMRLAFITPRRTTTVGQCSASLEVQLQDDLGSATPASASISVALASTAPTAAFFSDASCTATITQLTFAPGAAMAAFYAQGSAPGTPQLTATGAALAPANQTLDVVADDHASDLRVGCHCSATELPACLLCVGFGRRHRRFSRHRCPAAGRCAGVRRSS